jgi:predicted Zn-dependent peptidase
LGWRSLHVLDDDRWAMAVANQILGGGMASRLFQEVREDRGLAYSVYSHPSAYADAGCLTVYCGTAPKRATEALAVIDEVVTGITEGGVTDEELRVAAGYLEGSMLLGLEDSGGRMGRLGRGLMHDDRITTIDEHARRLRAVTTDDVQRALRRVLGSPRSLAAVGPFDTEDLLG